MLAIALRHRPHAVCLVPERREERTTEGGLDAAAGLVHLTPFVRALGEAGCRDDAVHRAGAGAGGGGDSARRRCRRTAHRRLVPCERRAPARRSCSASIRRQSWRSASGIECHAGHGLSYDNVGPVAAVPEIVELNIGHFLIGEAIFLGLAESIARMRTAMDVARGTALAVAAISACPPS